MHFCTFDKYRKFQTPNYDKINANNDNASRGS